MQPPIRAAILIAAAVSLAAPAAAQVAARQSAIILMRGADTILVQRLSRTPDRVESVVEGRGMPRIAAAYELAPTHRVPRVTFSAFAPNAPAGATPVQRGVAEFVGDSAFLTIRAGESTRELRLGTRAGAFPLFNNDFVVLEQGARILRASGEATLTMPLLTMAGGQTIDAQLERFAPDSLRLNVVGNITVAAVDAEGHVVGGYLPGQGIRFVIVSGPAAASANVGAPDYSAAPGAPYTAEEVTVTTPMGHSLAGTLTLPSVRRGRVPAVVTITGSGQQDRDETISIVPGFRLFRQVADTLGRRGIAVLRLDDRGIGRSGGDVNGTTADFADDIRAAVAYLRARPEIDPQRIALVGHSEGGMIAPMVAADDRRLAAIVLMAGPSWPGRRIIDYQIRSSIEHTASIAAASRDSAVAAALAQFDSTTGAMPWMRFFLDYDPLPTLRRVRQPVLILHGATDLQVTVEQAEEMARALRAGGNRRVTTAVFAERNHLFLRDPVGAPAGYSQLPSSQVDGEVMGRLADWLAATLRAR